MPEGQIVRGLSSFYYVEANNQVLECKARGIFKLRKEAPLVGDYVTFEIVNEKQGLISAIKPRKSELLRPPISNVDQVVLVFSVEEPKFNQQLLDKFLVHVEKANVKPIICLTKNDLRADQDFAIEAVQELYQGIGYHVIKTDISGQGLTQLRELLKDRISVFAGQSGVGKSTLLNSLLPSPILETAAISIKLGRGKHTTRETQLIHLIGGGMVADTPGFSQLDFQGIMPDELGQYFIEFSKWLGKCRFRGCQHNNEPGCAIKEAVKTNEIASLRYQHYHEFLEEIKEREQNKWR